MIVGAQSLPVIALLHYNSNTFSGIATDFHSNGWEGVEAPKIKIMTFSDEYFLKHKTEAY